MSLLIFFIVLAVLVLSHEFGHFIVAKLNGIRVDEFGFGFPPKLFGIKKGETEYTFNLIPFGGFVRIFGEDDLGELSPSDTKDMKRSLASQPKRVQAAVMFGGVFFNFLLAWFLISGSITLGAPVSIDSLPERLQAKDVKLAIVGVMPDSPAFRSGLSPGDEILYVTSHIETLQGDDLKMDRVQDFISTNGGKDVFIGYKRVGSETTATAQVIPVPGIVPGKNAIGVSLGMVGTLKLPFYKSIFEGFIITARLVVDMVIGLSNFIYGFFVGESSIESVSGPVGMVKIVGDASRVGIVAFMNIIALISINLAVLNLIPFPALDGGRLLFLFFEYLKGSPIDPKVAGALNALGFLLLLSFMAVVTYSDILKAFFS